MANAARSFVLGVALSAVAVVSSPREAGAQRITRSVLLTPVILHSDWFFPGWHTIRTKNTTAGGDPVLHVGKLVGTSVTQVASGDDEELPNARATFHVASPGAYLTVLVRSWVPSSAGRTDLEIDGVTVRVQEVFGGDRRPVTQGPYHYETAIDPFLFSTVT